MSNALEQRKDRRLRLAEQAKAIDEAAAGAMELFHGAEVSTEKELALACAVVDLRAALTEEVMQPIMSLMNSPLGFLTDKDPSKPVQKDGKWETPKPYGVDTVRDCVIAAKMLGFRVVGNEMNIISGKFYPAKAGFRRKLTDGKSFPGLTDFRDTYEVPRLSNGGAIVKARATWKRHGAEDSLEIEIPVRLNAGMGSDAALGKAERKLCKRVHDILLGMSTPDADVETDGQTINVKSEVVRDEVPSVRTGARTKQSEAGDGHAEGTKPPEQKGNQNLSTIRRRLVKEEIAEGAAMTTIHRMFNEAQGCNTLEEVEEVFPNVINAITRSLDSFIAASRTPQGEDGGVE